jgi:protein phosphatase 2C family protein 2/3
MERVCENTVTIDFKQAKMVATIGESWHSFLPAIRSGDWSDIGGRDYMEDAHVCIPNLAKNFGYKTGDDEIISFYGVIAYSLLNSYSPKTCATVLYL